MSEDQQQKPVQNETETTTTSTIPKPKPIPGESIPSTVPECNQLLKELNTQLEQFQTATNPNQVLERTVINDEEELSDGELIDAQQRLIIFLQNEKVWILNIDRGREKLNNLYAIGK